MEAWLLGSGGWIPTARRETTCVLIRHGKRALLLDAGTGLRRLLTEPALLDGANSLDIVLTHFHLDHVCGLGYTPVLDLLPTIWAPGRWLHGRSSDAILEPLRRAPLSPFDAEDLGDVRELGSGEQQIADFTVRARAQEKHWGATAGLRVDDALALVTDTAYDEGSAEFAHGVTHLLHEAWSTSTESHATTAHSTAAEAARVSLVAGAEYLTLVHLNPRLTDEEALRADARRYAPGAEVGEDGVELTL